MPTAILIGFEYNTDKLLGTAIDLYNAFKWCNKFCKTYILTDIVCKDTKQNRIFRGYNKIKNKILVTNEESLLLYIDKILQRLEDTKLVIYYTGHGICDSILMPNKSLLSFIKFRDYILNRLDPYVEIFWILDCCNPNGLNLPYKLKNNIFRLSSNQNLDFISNPVLLITSSSSNEKSLATEKGSIFSKKLFQLLNNRTNRNLTSLVNKIINYIKKTGHCQNVSVYSSYFIDPVLWMWIGSKKKYDIVTDFTLSILVIRLF